MKKQKTSAAKRTRPYPLQTAGSRIAAEARRETNKLSREERRKLFAEAMLTVYGGHTDPQATGTRH